jgi:hypothetical protein
VAAPLDTGTPASLGPYFYFRANVFYAGVDAANIRETLTFNYPFHPKDVLGKK